TPSFACIGDFSSTGDTISVAGVFKTKDDATAITRVNVEIMTERDGSVAKYSFNDGSTTQGGQNSSINLLRGYVRDHRLELEKTQNVDQVNCFNVTADKKPLNEVHLCLRKSDGTHSPKGFLVSDLVSGNDFRAADCR